ASRRIDDEVDRRRAESGKAAQAGHHRAALGKYFARQGFPQGRDRLCREEQGLHGGGGRVVRAERQGLLRAARQGEGGQGRSLPRRRAPARLHHHAAPVRDGGDVQQDLELRRAREREAGGGGAGQEGRAVHLERGVV